MSKKIKHYSPRGPRLFLDFSTDGAVTEFPYMLKMAIRDAIEKTLLYEEFCADAEVSVTLCDNESIRMLNSSYRNKDSATDVLSFPLYERDELLGVSGGDGRIPLGDIVISCERASEQAVELGNSFVREVAFLAVHSTLHLLGYDHELSPADEEDMCERQRKIIKAWEKERKQ